MLIDANVFFEANRKYYSRSICPGYWDALEHYATRGSICSIDLVRDEILRGNESDWAREWASDRAPQKMWLSTECEEIKAAFEEIARMVRESGRYRKTAQDMFFASNTDGMLIATAKVHGRKIVTMEKSDAKRRKEVKIPDLCKELGVAYLNTYQMLDELEIRFDWSPPADGAGGSP